MSDYFTQGFDDDGGLAFFEYEKLLMLKEKEYDSSTCFGGVRNRIFEE